MATRQRQRQIWNPAALVFAITASVALEAGACAASPALDLGLVSDNEVAEALAAGFNLPVLALATSSASEPSWEDWSAAVDTERDRLAALLRAFGYLDARIEVVRKVPAQEDTATALGADADQSTKLDQIELRPIPGERYRIGTIQIAGLGDDGLASLRDDLRDLVRAFIGKVARSDTLARLEDEIDWRVRSMSYPFAKVTGRDVFPAPSFKATEVRIVIDAGPAARFGPVTFRGLSRVDPRSLAAYVPFSPGDQYRPEVLTSFGETLRRLPVFRTVNVSLADTPDANGLAGVEVAVRETPVDLDRLVRSRSIGMALLVSGLAALAIRQVALALGVLASSRQIRISSFLVFLLLATSGWFVLERVLVLANIG